MKNHLPYLFYGAFSLLCANAAPPLNLISSAQLTATSGAANNITLSHISVGLLFPPGSQPPQDPFIWELPFSFPEVTLRFQRYRLIQLRNEYAIDQCFRDAILECAHRRLHDQEMFNASHPRPREWRGERVVLKVKPETARPGQPGLTYGSFIAALQGLNEFRRFYTHLNFDYEIWVNLPPAGFVYLARGELEGV